jgi:uncharacterized protein (DUF58 family)
MTPGRRVYVVALLLASLVGGLVTGREIFYTLAYVWGGLLLASLLWALSGLYGLRVLRHTRATRAQVGRPFEQRLALRNTSRLPKLWVEVRDESTLPGHSASNVVEGLGGKQERAWLVRTTCRYRGRFALGPLTLTAGDPFGLFQFSRRLPETHAIVVLPASQPLTDFALPVGLMPGGEALRRRTHFITPNASTVRDYVPGDSISRMHWRSTARLGRLIVKEFELDPLTDIWVFLDAERGAHAYLEEDRPEDDLARSFWALPSQFELPLSTEEYCVSATATLIRHFVRLGRSVGFAAYGQTREVVQADRGERQLSKLLETLAVLRAEGGFRFDQLLAVEGEQLARGTTILAITASPDRRWPIVAESLHRRGLRLVAVVVDPAGFDGIRGMAFCVDLLRGAGIPTYVVQRGDDIARALSPGAALADPQRTHHWSR